MTPDDAAFPRQAEPGRDTVGALQRALLPATVPVVAGARIAARYLLADDEAGAGGDWYDALALPGGRVALVVGDVVGHGIGATAAMAQLGAILRARLRDGAGPAEAVRCLDRYAAGVPAARASTLCLAVLACGTGELEYHTAGHPPPLLVSGEQARYLPGSGGGPLGTGGPIRFARTRMAPDDLLLLYSDGLVERPGRGAAGSTVELARAAVDAITDGTFEAGLSPDAAERVCQVTVDTLTRATGHGDDVTLLAAQRVPRPRPLRIALPARPASVRAAREALAHWLAAFGPGHADALALQHAVGELVTNSVEHAYGDDAGTVELRADLADDGRVDAEVIDHGHWQEPDLGALYRGNGLAIARELMDELTVRRDPAGTRVRVRHQLTRPAGVRTDPVAGQRGRPVGVPFGTELDTDREPARLRVRGPVDLSTAEALRLRLRQATRGGVVPATIDLSAVSLLASAGVQALYEALGRGAAQGSPPCLYAPAGSPAQHILATVRLPHTTTPPTATHSPARVTRQR